MPGTMEDVGDSNRGRGAGGFQGREASMVVYHIIRQQNFFSSARQHVARRGIIQAAKHRYSGEQQHILAVPKSMLWRRRSRHRNFPAFSLSIALCEEKADK